MGLFEGFSSEEKQEPIKKESKKTEFKRSRKGIVDSIIVGDKVIIDVDGNGESIKYDEKEHSHLKKGDTIYF